MSLYRLLHRPAIILKRGSGTLVTETESSSVKTFGVNNAFASTSFHQLNSAVWRLRFSVKLCRPLAVHNESSNCIETLVRLEKLSPDFALYFFAQSVESPVCMQLQYQMRNPFALVAILRRTGK